MTQEEMEKFCDIFNDIFMDRTIRCRVAVKPELMMFFEIGDKRLVLDSELNRISNADPRLDFPPLPKLSRFLDLCLIGEAELDAIDDFIENWHNSVQVNQLHDYLGMTWEEYCLWVADPNSLASIIDARRKLMTTDTT